MKLFLICLLAFGLLTFVSGCADEGADYGAYQKYAQRSQFDPLYH